MSAVKEGCRKAFIARPQRLVAAMYSSSITVNGEVLGESFFYYISIPFLRLTKAILVNCRLMLC